MQRMGEKNDLKKDSFIRTGVSQRKKFVERISQSCIWKSAYKLAHAFRHGSRRQAPKLLVRTRTLSKTNPISLILQDCPSKVCPRDFLGAAYNRKLKRHSTEANSLPNYSSRPLVHHIMAVHCKILFYETPFSSSRPGNGP